MTERLSVRQDKPGWPQTWPPPDYPPRLRVNWFDRKILGKRDPWRPVALLRFERLRWTVVLAILVGLLFSGMIALAGQSKSYRNCIQRNESALRYRADLDRRAQLAHNQKQYRDEAIYRSLRPRDQLPGC